MFLLNFGPSSPNAVFRDVAASTDGRLGACLLASGFDSGQLIRKELPEASPLLFDPQLYLAGLPASADDCRVWRLASHPWFGVENVTSFQSDEQRKREWEEDVKAAALTSWASRPPTPLSDHSEAAIRAQMQIGCTMVILPSPLLTAREEEAAPAVEWTRAGVAAARKHGCSLPLLATVALDERVLNEAAFAPLGYLDAVVSQISACRGIHGVYVVIAQTGDPGHPFKTGELVHRAYASLCRRFREARRIETVFPNFCDIGGFVCVARGATGFATGNFQSTRRLMLSGGADGRPYLYYYAHSAATEFRPEEDLDPIAEAGLFERIADPTPYAAALVTALRTTRSAAGQQPWLMTINNVGTAQRHQLYRMCLSTHGVLSSSAENRYAVVEQWASTAVTLQSGLLAKVDPQKTRYTAPVDALLRALRAA